MQRKARPDSPPNPQELAAYADGELDAAARARIEAWLTEYPETMTEIEAQRRLHQVFASSLPAEPAESDWAGVLRKIDLAIPQSPETSRHPSRLSAWLRILGSGAAAAAVLLAFLLWHPSQPPRSPQPEVDEPLAVATAEDVDIISLDDADCGVLVVGQPPLAGPMVLGGRGDMTVISIKPDSDGMVPQVTFENVETPMIVAPLLAQLDP